MGGSKALEFRIHNKPKNNSEFFFRQVEIKIQEEIPETLSFFIQDHPDPPMMWKKCVKRESQGLA